MLRGGKNVLKTILKPFQWRVGRGHHGVPGSAGPGFTYQSAAVPAPIPLAYGMAQVGWGIELLGLIGGIPTHGRGLEDDL